MFYIVDARLEISHRSTPYSAGRGSLLDPNSLCGLSSLRTSMVACLPKQHIILFQAGRIASFLSIHQELISAGFRYLWANLIFKDQGLPGSPVVKMLSSQYRGHGFDPCSGNEDPTCPMKDRKKFQGPNYVRIRHFFVCMCMPKFFLFPYREE